MITENLEIPESKFCPKINEQCFDVLILWHHCQLEKEKNDLNFTCKYKYSSRTAVSKE